MTDQFTLDLHDCLKTFWAKGINPSMGDIKRSMGERFLARHFFDAIGDLEAVNEVSQSWSLPTRYERAKEFNHPTRVTPDRSPRKGDKSFPDPDVYMGRI